MSQEGYDKLVAELHHMETVELAQVKDAIAEARDKGDLSENFEYHAPSVNRVSCSVESVLSRRFLLTLVSSTCRISLMVQSSYFVMWDLRTLLVICR